MAQARSYSKGIFPPAYSYAAGLDEGDVTIFTTPNADSTPQVIKPTGSAPWLQAFYGVYQNRGTIGGSGTAAGEAIALTRQGLARIKQAFSTTVTRGAQLIANAANLGTVSARTPYSFSALVIGNAEEAQTTGASGQNMLEAYIQPHAVEVVRQITAGTTSTFGANTKYLGSAGTTQPASQVALYVCRFTGETIRNLAANLATAPGGTDTVAFTVQTSSDNGATWSDSALTCTITGTAKAATDLTHSATLTAGDLLAIKTVSSATTAAVATVTFDVT